MKRTSFAILIGLFCLFPALFSQVRSEFLLEKNWKFTREDRPEFINPTFNDSKWQSVTVPHDWAIYGPFSSQNDKQEVAIAQDGQTEAWNMPAEPEVCLSWESAGTGPSLRSSIYGWEACHDPVRRCDEPCQGLRERARGWILAVWL